MCLMVWIGTEQALPLHPGSQVPDPVTGYARIEAVDEDALVRRNLPATFVSYVGSHEGCGCGFNSNTVAYLGYDDEDEIRPLLGALLDEERAEYLAERASRERLHALIEASLAHGPVIMLACWAGEEGSPPVADEEVDLDWLLRKTAPLADSARYTVKANATAGGAERHAMSCAGRTAIDP